MLSEGVLLLVFFCFAASISAQQNHYVNIAPGKTYSQISTYYDQESSGNAANGNTSGYYDPGNCIHTGHARFSRPDPPDENHWWQVDLGQVYPVYNIKVWAREHFNGRLYPSIITVDGQLCVNVTSDPGTRNHSVTCANIMYGRVVRLTLTRVEYLNLCELQIFVCEEGYYGTNCTSPCDVSCEGGCYRDSGNCTDCKDGFWGSYKCQQSCSSHCSTGVCQRDNGYCNGCKAGYYGAKCDASCSSFSSRCTQCLQDGTCTACSGHFVPPACTACRGNFAGTSCTECQAGYYGVQCDMMCSSRTTRCSECDRQNGTCTACSGHSVPPDCTECQTGYYGAECNMMCSSRTTRCLQCRQNGTCTACSGPFVLPDCTAKCDSNNYGQNCSESCGQCKGRQPCDTETGHCTTGCQPGYTGLLCKTQEKAPEGNIVYGVVGFIVGAAVATVIAVVAAVCWYRRFTRDPAKNHPNTASPARDTPDVTATNRSVDKPPDPREATAYYEICDTANAHEMRDVENNYDKLHPYNNTDADRAPYATMTSNGSDVEQSSENNAYTKTAL